MKIFCLREKLRKQQIFVEKPVAEFLVCSEAVMRYDTSSKPPLSICYTSEAATVLGV